VAQSVKRQMQNPRSDDHANRGESWSSITLNGLKKGVRGCVNAGRISGPGAVSEEGNQWGRKMALGGI